MNKSLHFQPIRKEGEQELQRSILHNHEEEIVMQVHSILMSSWAMLASCFLGLLVYCGHLTRYEDEQLFLGAGAELQEREHTAIVRKVTRLEPLLRLFGGAASLATASAVGIYVWNAWQQIR